MEERDWSAETQLNTSGVTLNADLEPKSFSVTIQHKQKRLKSALNFD